MDPATTLYHIRRNDLVQALRRSRLSVTPQRLALLRALHKSDKHPSAEMLLRRLKKYFPSLSLTTIYNNLSKFEDAGLVTKVVNLDGTDRYEAGEATHPHFICNKCKSIDHDVDNYINPDLARMIGALPDFYVTRISIEFYGICKECKDSKILRLEEMRKRLESWMRPDVCKRWPTRFDLK